MRYKWTEYPRTFKNEKSQTVNDDVDTRDPTPTVATTKQKSSKAAIATNLCNRVSATRFSSSNGELATTFGWRL